MFLTVNEGDDLAGGSTDLAQGTGGVGDGRAGGSRDLGESLRSLGGRRRSGLTSLGGSLRGGGSVSDGGSPGQELRLPQDGTGGGGHFVWWRKGVENREVSESHPKQSLLKRAV